VELYVVTVEKAPVTPVKGTDAALPPIDNPAAVPVKPVPGPLKDPPVIDPVDNIEVVATIVPVTTPVDAPVILAQVRLVRLLPSPENEDADTAPENNPVPVDIDVEKLPIVPDTVPVEVKALHQIVFPTPRPPETYKAVPTEL
jgi:hypothetical protein